MNTQSTLKTLAGLVALGFVGVPAAVAQFTSDKVALNSWIDLGNEGLNASNGNDCWGYVSPSGREYALMGVSNKLAVVEITDPDNPVIIGQISHSDSLWADVKVYQDYCYVGNESGGGIDVIDLSDVDNGNVALVQRFTDGGSLQACHNVALDPISGYLYTCGNGNYDGRLVAYDLSNPEAPAFAGQVPDGVGSYVHDAQVVTYTSGPYDGRQIAFCSNGGAGVDIYDVTDKGNMFRLSRTPYPNLSYCHQCWLSADRQYLYINDELDSVNETVVLDVSDLSNPFVATTYDSGVSATDHNVYTHNGFIFEAEYRAGLRIFCADDPLNPVQVGWFDTYPGENSNGFDGAWSVYPYFPSGTVIISDITRGLFIVNPSEALASGALDFDYPDGLPEQISPAGGTTVRVELEGTCGAVAAPETGVLHYDVGNGFQSIPMDEVSDNVYDAVFPEVPCAGNVAYYFSAEKVGGGVFNDPPNAPNTTYSALAASDIVVVQEDDFETDQGWVAENLGAQTGDWERAIPINDPDWNYDPTEDGDGSGQCYLTENTPGNSDVDEGSVRLTSPIFDMSAGGELLVAYEYYLFLTLEDGDDMLLVEMSDNGDTGPWAEVVRHTTSGGLSWRHHEVTPQDLQAAGLSMTASMKIRFTANDSGQQSINESGVDGFQIIEVICEEPILGDLNGDGVVGVADLLILFAEWGPCDDCNDCPADLNGDCTVGVGDLLILFANWG